MDQAAEHIAIDQFPAEARQNAWLGALMALSLDCRMPERGPASGSITLRHSQSGAVLALLHSRPQQLQSIVQASANSPVSLILCLSGRGRLICGRKSIELAEGVLCALDMADRWTIDWRSDFEILILRLPRTGFASRLGRARVTFPVALGKTVAAIAVRPILRTLAGHIDLIDQADLSVAETAVTELAASALLSELKADEGGVTQVQAAHFRRVSAAIERQLQDTDLGMTDIAAKEGMSVRYLQRLFEKRGESFSDYVRNLRLERCRADLIDPNHNAESIAEIGNRWGFRDQAHFSRAFSTAFGISPRILRRNLSDTGEVRRQRGKPSVQGGRSGVTPSRPKTVQFTAGDTAEVEIREKTPRHHYLPANRSTVHWGYLSRLLAPVLRVGSGERVTIETLTQHAYDDHERMIKGDPGAESVFEWTSEYKAIDRRGAGPINASVFGRGAGEGFGVHICTGPIHVRGAEPGDILEVEILGISPRPCANPDFAGKAFASNASAWWGFQYHDLLDQTRRRETVTIYEIDLQDAAHARALYSFEWTPQTDPFGVVHATMDYPGIPVDRASIQPRNRLLEGVRVPARPHFGFIAVAPREAEIIDSIPPGYFGGNIDNWRAGPGSKIYLPVSVPGALLSIGDGHFAQGDGEINGTGLECSLTGDIRIRLHKQHEQLPPHLHGFGAPLIETADCWVIQSFSYPQYLRDLGRNAQAEVYGRSTVDLALRNAFQQARRFLMDTYALSEDEAMSLMSLAVDFGITQVADGNLGVHATIRKSLFAGRAEKK